MKSIISFLLILFYTNGFAQTYVSGTISNDTTWTLANSPYIVNGDITVNATLSIEAGVVIKFDYNGDKHHLIVNGVLDLQGTSDNPVVFTSNRDDSYGGDTNGDGATTSPAAGDWEYVKINNSGADITHCIFKYGGYDYNSSYSMLWIKGTSQAISVSNCEFSHAYEKALYYEANNSYDSSPVISNNKIDNSPYGISLTGSNVSTTAIITENKISGGNNYGIIVSNVSSSSEISGNTINNQSYGIGSISCSPLIKNNVISNCANYPFAQINSSFPEYEGNTLTNNGKPGISVRGTISEKGIWNNVQNLKMPYILTGDIKVNAKLSIKAGVVIKFDYNGDKHHLIVNGALDLQGTSDNPVVFTSNRDDSYGGDTNGDGATTSPAAGDWEYVKINNSGADITHCIFKYGGYDYNSSYSMLWIKGTSQAISVSNCEFSHAYEKALYYEANSSYDSSPVISNNKIDNSPYGIYLTSSRSISTIAKINGNEISNCSNTGIYLSNTSNGSFISGCDISSNKTGIYLANGFVSIHHNNITGNTDWGLENISGNSITAENNWWGDASGPSGEGSGSGDAVSANVDFNPWSDEPWSMISAYYGDISQDGTVSPYDASLAMQYKLGLISLDDDQKFVGDVSGNGSVTDYDASLILQYVVGLIDHFPVENGQIIAKTNQTKETKFNISIAKYDEITGDLIVNAYLTDAKSVGSIYLALEYDSLSGTFDNFILSDEFKNYLSGINDSAGVVHIALAGTELPSGNLNIGSIVFKNLQIDGKDFFNTLNIKEISINEQTLNVTSIDDSQNSELTIPDVFYLEQNFPNPFNMSTTIRFGLPRQEYVELKIYDSTGRLIKELIKSRMSAGIHSVIWNGLTSQGKTVSSGIYYMQIKAGALVNVKKIIVTK